MKTLPENERSQDSVVCIRHMRSVRLLGEGDSVKPTDHCFSERICVRYPYPGDDLWPPAATVIGVLALIQKLQDKV